MRKKIFPDRRPPNAPFPSGFQRFSGRFSFSTFRCFLIVVTSFVQFTPQGFVGFTFIRSPLFNTPLPPGDRPLISPGNRERHPLLFDRLSPRLFHRVPRKKIQKWPLIPTSSSPSGRTFCSTSTPGSTSWKNTASSITF